jgi:NhaC family Na+:H+ antiporter
MVGALAGTWLVSGIIPSMILRFTNSKSGNILASHRDNMLYNFIATGSSWTTSATVGIALIGVGGALGFDLWLQ